MRVPTPAWSLIYQGKNITQDIAGDVISVTYTDKLHGESDDLELEIEDRDGRWRDAWYPGKGDTIEATIGLDPGGMMPAGTFKIDEISFRGDGRGDTVTIRALAAAITQELRTRRSESYEGTDLATVIDQVAARHELEVVGPIDPVPLERVSQDDESDLAFIKRLAETYGHAATVRGDQLVFHRMEELRAGNAALVLSRRELARYQLQDQGQRIYQAATVSYQDPETKELVEHTVEAQGVASGDTLKRYIRAENPAQAEKKAKALLDEQNRREVAGSLTVDGRPQLVAGVNIALEQMGRLGGTYLITESTHSQDRKGGYTTELEVERV